MCARNARTEAAHPAASADSEEKDVKIPVEDADEVRADTPAEPEPVEETPAEGTDTAAADASEMSEEEMIEAAIRAGEEAAENDFKLKYEQAQNELAEVRRQLAEAEEVREGADARVREATERAARLQADWENFRRRTAAERLAERERATEKLVTALLPVLDDIERAIDHARTQEMADDMKQFVDGVDAVHTKMVDVLAHEGVETIDPAGEAFNPLEHQAVGRVEDPDVYDETVRDVYQKGYRMADRILRAAMVTVTYGGAKRPAPEPADVEEPAREQPSDTATEAPQE
ncbi:nucleotide exchange factor GrpE [Collinsella intestinalis]|nr:nucleotide exchange factor GrpE [Collinsella intestinalis]MBM6908366.1 nucleotide exchange factor GrpE [Collinsella intestinalis]